MWSASVPDPRRDWPPGRNGSEMKDTFARPAHLAHGTLGSAFMDMHAWMHES